MIAGTNAWAELAKASFTMMKTNIRMNEMMIASGSVIEARMKIMGDATRSPAQGDYVEIGGMAQEKVVAIGKVNQALVEQWSSMMADATEQAQHLRDLMFGGKPLSIGDLSELTERWMAHGTRMITRTMDTSGLALAPVHEQATANARRLS